MTEPEWFVDREEFVEELEGRVQACLDDDRAWRGRIVITGEKGVGKTVFTRHVMRRLHEANGGGFLLVEVDGKGHLTHRGFLDKLANQLVAAARAAARTRIPGELAEWLRELKTLASNSTLMESDASTTTKGSTAGGRVSLLAGLTLDGTLQWTEQRQLARTATRTVSVDERVLSEAIRLTLDRVRALGVPVVLFLNDLDQAVSRENPEEVRRVLGRLVEFEDCIQVLNVRTEVLYDDLRRESQMLSLPPMPAEALTEMIGRRTHSEPDGKKRAALTTPEAEALTRRLAGVNGNPFALLVWLNQIHSSFGADRFSLTDPAHRRALVVAATGLPDDGLLERVATAVDTASPSWAAWVQRGELEVQGIRATELDALVRAGVLVPRDVFDVTLGLRLEAVQDLLRPSVASRLA